ncbi:MAG TPA: secretin N-terminal domain-containing protein, partial [Candidatus Dormibacteraeota bacterium]|nr:secretin N-terminal domain-containing protein [Candidatus Dormibacteraeota bacterium]
MTASSRAACWLLVVELAGGCASAAPPPRAPTAGGPADEPGRPRVEVTTEPPTSPRTPVRPPPVVPPPSPTETEPDKAATAPTPPESGVPPSAAPPAAAADAPTPAAARPRARLLVLNFDNADVEVVIQAAAEIVGFNYVLAPAARGRKITVQTVGKISSDEVFAVLLTILDVNGLAAVRSGNLYRIIPREGAPQTPIKTIVGREVSASLPPDEVVTQVVPLQFIGAQDAVALLRPFVHAQGALAAHRETNVLILTDTAANVRRLLEVLALVDVEVALSELQIITLKHADAQELGQLLAQLFASGRVGGAPGAPPAPGPLAPPASPPGALSPPPGAGPAAPTALIVPERRSNSLVVHARKQDMEIIRRLIEKLDVDI